MHISKIKISRRRIPHNFCPECLLNVGRCICESIPTLTLKTKISLIIHAAEMKRTTNTGRLALKALTNSEMRIRGEGRESLNLSDLLSPNYRTLLFFPTEGATLLDHKFVSESTLPIQLIVPDGNWRQARKVHSRHPELLHIPRVKISVPETREFFMRSETKEGGLATLEAIAHALGIIEGEEVKNVLLKFYQTKLEETLKGRGQFKGDPYVSE